MKTVLQARSLLLLLTLVLLAGCSGSSSTAPTPAPAPPLRADRLNLIFVTSPDLAYHASGDINPDTANLSIQGLQRSLLMATYLQQNVLGAANVTGIYALQPMTHLQTANNLPDMAALVNIQQFAALNQVSLTSPWQGQSPYASGSYPLNVSYAAGELPAGAAVPSVASPLSQGLVFRDDNLNNLALLNRIIVANTPGFHLFSAPWETVIELMTNINRLKGYNLPLPTAYPGPNLVYAISIEPAGGASLTAYDSRLQPATGYPTLSPPPPTLASCGAAPFSTALPGSISGAAVPNTINRNETVYFVRHAEAHPTSYWEDGNYAAAGQWRALALPDALRGKISPDMVYSIDPAQVIKGSSSVWGNSNWSYVRPSLTVAPYAIANNLPFKLISSIELSNLDSARQTSDFFFKNGTFTNQTILLAWEHDHFPLILQELFKNYFPPGSSLVPAKPPWKGDDYDSIWTVKLDGQGNLTVDNQLCEGIDSSLLPILPPIF